MRKNAGLLFILVFITLSLMTISLVVASVPKPSVPECTLEFLAHPFDVPPTYEIDPYTGEQVMTEEGYHVENKTVEISIKNQLYSYSIKGSNAWLAYNVMVKGHFEENGNTLYGFDQYTGGNLPNQSSSEYTVISVPADDYPVGGKVDFQVQAISVYQTLLTVYPYIMSEQGAYQVTGYAIGEFSDWSNTQTITIPDPSLPSPIPTLTSFSPDLSLTIVSVAVSVAVVCIVTFVYFKKSKSEVKPS